MKPLQKLETVDDVFAQAAHYAEYCMRKSGRMGPTLFLTGLNGPLMFMPQSLADEDEKDVFAATARLLCIAQGATVVVMALEAWIKMASPGEELDTSELPSESFNRQEVVVLMGESRTGQKQKILPIVRSGNGKFFGFGESDLPIIDKMEGRFAHLLPPQAPGPEDRLLAELILAGMGVNLAKAGSIVRLTPFQRR